MKPVAEVPAGQETGRRGYLEEFMAAPYSVSAAVFKHAVDSPEVPFIWVKNPGTAGLLSGLAPGIAGLMPGRWKIPITWRTYGLLVATATLALRQHRASNGCGIKAGDRVCILGENSLEWVVLQRAIQAIGAIAVPIHHNCTASDVAVIINDAEPALTLCDSKATLDGKINCQKVHARNQRFMLFADILHNEQRRAPDYIAAGRSNQPARACAPVLMEFERLRAELSGAGLSPPFKIDDPCLIIYTSGSTGKPKGAVHTHRGIASGCALVMDHGFGFTPADMVLHYLPLSHIFALGNSGLSLCEMYALPGAIVPGKQLGKALPLFRPTVLCGVPLAWESILAGFNLVAGSLSRAIASPESVPWKDKTLLFLAKLYGGLNRLRFGISGGAALDPDVIEAFQALGLRIFPGYGMSETQAVLCNNPLRNNPRSMGMPLAGVKLRLGPAPAEFCLPETAGELFIAGPQNFIGYFGDSERSEAAFVDGYFQTGDLVEVGPDGLLIFRGKVKGGKKLKNGLFYAEEVMQKFLVDTAKDLGLSQLFEPLVVGEGRLYLTVLLRIRPDRASSLYGGKPADEQDACAYYAANPEVVAAAQKLLQAANASIAGWNKSLTLGGWFIMPESPTFANGLLGPTGKLSLAGALRRYARQVDQLYARSKETQ